VPFGELGVVLQQDAAWQAQTAGPRDPQAGNIGGGQVDVKNNPGTAGTMPIYETAGSRAPAANAVPPLTDAQLAPVVAEAKQLWEQALGAGDGRLAVLDQVQVMVGNLPASRLGVTIGYQILIDANACGYGWYIDVSAQSPVDSGRMDLLTVVADELGNAMSFPEDARETDAVTSPILSAGSRHLPGESPTAGLMRAPAARTAVIGAPPVPAAPVPAAVTASEPAAARVAAVQTPVDLRFAARPLEQWKVARAWLATQPFPVSADDLRLAAVEPASGEAARFLTPVGGDDSAWWWGVPLDVQGFRVNLS